ncbi:MAG TPA: HAMP domain-containing sensor histidine kinase [Lacibacter sp.]|nr:HAMP domain-containing sensor histidine kinase [Lacibacter sp.]
MTPSHTIRSFLYKNAYLPILAAWLLTFSFLFQFYWSYTSAPQQVRKTLERSIHNRQADFERFITDKTKVERLFTLQSAEPEFATATEKDYFLFFARITPDGPELKFWNTQIIQPTLSLWLHEDGQWFQKLINGYYIIIRKTITVPGEKSIAALALIPVKWEYFITTNDLNNSFAYLPSIEDYYGVSTREKEALAVRTKKGETLFYLTQKENTPQPLSLVTVILRLLALGCMLWLLHLAAVQIARQQKFIKGFLFLAVVLIALRISSYYLPIPIDFRQFELFDPAIYGSNTILKSLGDFLMNVLLLLWLLLFIKRYNTVKAEFRISNNELVAGALPGFLIYWMTVQFGIVIRSLVADSQISFDVTNIFSLSAYSFTGFFILGCVALCFYLLLELLYEFFKRQTRDRLLLQLFIIIVVAFLYLTLSLGSELVQFNLGLLLWLIPVIIIIRWHKQVLSFLPSGGNNLFWLFFFSASFTMLLLYENGKKEWSDRKRMAEKLSLQTDPSAENLLSIALKNFRSDFLQDNFYRFNTQGNNQYLKDSLLGEHFSGYLNKFDTRIFTYDAEEEPLFNDDSTAYNTLNTIFNLQSKPLPGGEWRYYEESYDRFYYIARREIVDTSSFQQRGTVFIISKPRRYTGEKFYPELFSKTFNVKAEDVPAYAYAMYKRGELINSYNDYPFPIHLPKHHTVPSGFHSHDVNGYSELWFNASADRAVVVVKKKDSWLQAITLFAYLFLIFLLMWAVYRLFRFLVMLQQQPGRWWEYLQLNFRSQVHTTITAISIFSFLVIGVSTIFFFINRHNRTNKERLSRTIQIMRTEVEEAMQQHAILDDMLKLYDEVANSDLQAKVNRISEIHGVDVNVYDPEGLLRVSSQPYYYNKGLLSRRMEPFAFYKLTRQMLVQTIEQEKVGSRSYMSIYVPVRDETGKAYAYLNIPYFTSQNELRQEISSFLVTLINLNAFIFLITGLIAFFVTNRITSSFSLISQKMKEVQLGKANEAISWNRSDEIGELVTEYNKMVTQLERSAALLAKSEREGAWREMARQVAHEIKNPLTPMKLSIQHLQKAIDNNSTDAKNIAQSVAKTLVEQIDYLSNIASDFSNFANIGNTKMERIHLHQSIDAVVQLFRSDEQTKIIFSDASPDDVFVTGDKTQMNRLFTNLLRNAQEAHTGNDPLIEVAYTVEADQVIVSVKDNGDGIDASLRDKIFYPNFTTKTSGTGLGLAMCKGIVEVMKGEIWFTTETGKGTTFFVKLPLAS